MNFSENSDQTPILHLCEHFTMQKTYHNNFYLCACLETNTNYLRVHVREQLELQKFLSFVLSSRCIQRQSRTVRRRRDQSNKTPLRLVVSLLFSNAQGTATQRSLYTRNTSSLCFRAWLLYLSLALKALVHH